MNVTGIGQPHGYNSPLGRALRFREALSGYGAFLLAARRPDPLPTLRDLACDWLRAEDVDIMVPAGTNPLNCEEPGRICGPIVIGRRVVGRIEARRKRPFDEDDQALLGMLGQVVGAALEYNLLQSQLDERACAAQAHADTLDRLLSFGREVLRGGSDPVSLATHIAGQVPDMVGGERASVLLLPHEPGDDPVLVLSSGRDVSTERAREVADDGLAGLVLRERMPIIIDETDTDRRWLDLDLQHHDSRTRCAMAVPLLWGEQILGALTVTTSASRLFSTTQLNLLELVACHVSLAVHSATADARLAASSATLGALATYLEAGLDAAAQGDQAAALAIMAAVAARLRAEQTALTASEMVSP
ncbi:MAG: GAF domain-containing protein [Oscillochloridaceae bacterium umkhey_bin13]